MNDAAKSEKQKLLSKGNFGTFHKPLAMKMGIEAALILNQLIDKYDYWVRNKGKFKKYGNHKAFYITYKDLSGDGKIVSLSKLNRKGVKNPLQILEQANLIKRNNEWCNFKRVIYYILFFDNISKTFEILLEELNEKRNDQKKDMELREMEEGKKRGEFIDEFLKKNAKELKMNDKLNENKKLQNDSIDSETLTPSKESNKHITKNKMKKNKMKKNKMIKDKIKLTQERERNEDDSTFSEDELDKMLNPEKYSEIYNLNTNELEQDNFDVELLYEIIFKTRTGILSPKEFFNTISNVLLKDEFKGFKMSIKDEFLINDLIINNPLFELENEDIEERNEEVSYLKVENKNITQEKIDEEIDFDEDRYQHLYNHLWDKILYNCKRIIDRKLDARFGNIFVGVKEMSDNYEPFIERY